MRQDTEAGQAVSESARDPVRNSQIENRYPAFAEPDQKDGNKQQSQKQDDACGDQHVRLPSLLLIGVGAQPVNNPTSAKNQNRRLLACHKTEQTRRTTV
jgi:hypothetical protein